MAEYVPIFSIAIVLFALAELLKGTVLKNNDDLRAVIPYACAIIGAVAAAVMFAIDPSLINGASNIGDAIVAGAISGLVATGAHQFYKQFYNLIAVAKSIKTEIDSDVADMSTEEKKDYITDVASDMVTDFLNKVNGVEDETSDEKDPAADQSAQEEESAIITEVPDTDAETASTKGTKPY